MELKNKSVGTVFPRHLGSVWGNSIGMSAEKAFFAEEREKEISPVIDRRKIYTDRKGHVTQVWKGR